MQIYGLTKATNSNKEVTRQFPCHVAVIEAALRCWQDVWRVLKRALENLGLLLAGLIHVAACQ